MTDASPSTSSPSSSDDEARQDASPTKPGRPGNVDGGYAWVVLAATFLSFFICGGFLQTSGIVHTALLARFRDTVAKTSWAGSSFTAAVSLTAPVGSALIDRYSCRVAVVSGAVLVTLGFLITGLATNIETCIFSYGIVTGTGGGIIFAVLFVVNGFNFKERLNLAQGISLSGTGLGLFVLAPLLEMAKANYGFTGLCFILAGTALQMIVCGALMRPSEMEQQVKIARGSNKHRQAVSVQQKLSALIDVYKQALCSGYLALLCVSMFFYCGGVYTMFLHWPHFCVQRGLTAMQSSVALSVVGLVSVGGRISTGLLASLRCVSERLVYSGSLLVFGTALATFFLFSATFTGHVTLAVIVGLTNGSIYVVTSSLTSRGVGVQFLASAIGLQFTLGGVGSIVVPVISGYMIHSGSSYELIFSLCGMCILISAVLGFATKFVRTKSIDETIYIDDQIQPNDKSASELTDYNTVNPKYLNLEAKDNTSLRLVCQEPCTDKTVIEITETTKFNLDCPDVYIDNCDDASLRLVCLGQSIDNSVANMSMTP